MRYKDFDNKFDNELENAVCSNCNKKKDKIKVCLDSIELIKQTKAQHLWVKAYMEHKPN
ncbi:MAG: hypothetical protein HQK49_08110 [Oligoflexia bacterium]|nr:hypothetical protein [Oligoflexia bacterium]